MKKWTYLVASVSAVLTMGSVLTSCVDNDEPYGIEQVRLSYAKLLESKSVLAQAQASAETAKAEAEKIKAQAEATKAEIEKIKAEAEAEYVRACAQAELLRAQAANAVSEAEAARLLAEAAIAQAKADQIKAQTEMEMKERTAYLEAYIASAEQTLKQLELNYQSALLQYEKDKLDLTDYQANFVSVYFDAYFTALANYNKAYNNYLLAQKAYLKWQIDFSATNYTNRKNVEDAVADCTKALELANADLALYQEQLEEWKNTPADAIYSIIAEYKDRCVALKEEIEAVNVEMVAIPVENDDLFHQKDELTQIANDIYDEQVEIPNYTIDPATLAGYITDEAVSNFWKESGEFTVIDENKLVYFLNDQSNYDDALDTYQGWIDDFQQWILDENGQAWSEYKVNQYKLQLADAQKNQKDIIAAWTAVVAAINKGAEFDITKLPNYNGLVTAVAAYNKQAEKVSSLSAAIDAADAKVDAANDAYTAALGEKGKENKAILDKYTAAQDANKAAYDKAVADAEAAYEKTIANEKKAFEKAQSDYAAAYDDYNNIVKSYGIDSDKAKAAYTKMDAALKAEEAAKAALDAVKAPAETTKNNAIADAKYKQLTADTKAFNEWKAALLALNVDATDSFSSEAERAAIDKAAKAVVDATTAYNDAILAYDKAANDVIDLLIAVRKAVNAIGEGVLDAVPLTPELDSFETAVLLEIGSREPLDVTTAELVCPYNAANILDVFENVSYALYGPFKKYLLNEYDLYDLTEANGYLVSLDVAAINKIISRWYKETTGDEINPFIVPTMYPTLGAAGVVADLQNKIALYTAFMKNTDVIQGVINGLTEKYNATLQTLVDQKDKADAADQDVIAVQDQIDALYAPLAEQYAELSHQLADYETLLTTIYSAIENLNNYVVNDPINYPEGIILSQEDIDSAIEALETYISNVAEPAVKTAEDNLALAQYRLEAFNREEAEVMPDAEFDVMVAEQDLAVAELMLEVAKEFLNAAIAALNADAE